jgi:hypothetical protein
MPKFIRVGNQYVEEDPDFDPEKWQKEVPQEKMFREQIREELDITQDENQMDSLMNAIQKGDAEKRERLVGIDANAVGFEKDGKTDYIDDKGAKMTKKHMERINRQVDRTMFNTDLRISEFPNYVQKALRDRLK